MDLDVQLLISVSLFPQLSEIVCIVFDDDNDDDDDDDVDDVVVNGK
jgi:hypothetical protein